MEQPGFIELTDRAAMLGRLGDPPPKLGQILNWKGYRTMENIRKEPRKSGAGHRRFAPLLLLRVLLRQSPYNLSNDQTEYQILVRDPLCRLFALLPEGRTPGVKSGSVFREPLAQGGLSEPLYDGFSLQIKKPADRHYGRKRHIIIDWRQELTCCWELAPRNAPDREVFGELMEPTNTSADIGVGAVRCSQDRQQALSGRSYRSRMPRGGASRQQYIRADQTSEESPARRVLRLISAADSVYLTRIEKC